ncbi:MAG: hypothetical protein EHM55_01690 [Acidobacteria bacterium]|nr:MAG: hypothetical protein EHM55_01690 [Acidobacteriota bacterium]
MVIRFTSTLTDEDETRIASALLKAVGNLLALFPISYSIRIETTAGNIVEDSRAAAHLNPWVAPASPARREPHDRQFIQPATMNPPRKTW